MSFDNPYTNFHEINLNKFLKAVKNLLGGHGGEILQKKSNIPFDYEWSNISTGGAVDSVNGQTGVVVLTASDVGALPNSTVIPQPSNANPADLGTSAQGSSTRYARQDHVHKMPSASDVGALPDSTVIPQPANANPADLGTSAQGSSTRYARQDHVHKMPSASDVGALPDSTVIPQPANANPADLGTSAQGSSTRYARQDHVHKMPSASDVGALPDSTVIPQPANANPADLGTSAQGSSTRYARQDHVHKMPSASDVGALPDSTVIPQPANANPADLGTSAQGSSTRYARQDHVHKMPSASDVGLGNVANVLQYSANNPPPYPVTSVNGQTGAVTISGSTPADALPADLGTSAIGTSTKYARMDHVHKMPSASDVGALPDSTVIPNLDWTYLGASSSTSQTVTYPATAKEILIKAKSSHANNHAYFNIIPVTALSGIAIIGVGGYYYGSSDFGYANVNHVENNRTLAFRNIRYANNTAGTFRFWYR